VSRDKTPESRPNFATPERATSPVVCVSSPTPPAFAVSPSDACPPGMSQTGSAPRRGPMTGFREMQGALPALRGKNAVPDFAFAHPGYSAGRARRRQRVVVEARARSHFFRFRFAVQPLPPGVIPRPDRASILPTPKLMAVGVTEIEARRPTRPGHIAKLSVSFDPRSAARPSSSLNKRRLLAVIGLARDSPAPGGCRDRSRRAAPVLAQRLVPGHRPRIPCARGWCRRSAKALCETIGERPWTMIEE